jgi:putative Ca2+/H+ antiporter (TMEM165/GDT1 family)
MVFAVTVGTVAVLLLPRRPLEAVVAALFLAGALLSLRELLRARRAREEDVVEAAPATGFARAALTAFGVVFVAEWGDLTQILAANLAAHYRDPLAVGVGATLALWAVAGVAVAGGRWLGRVMDTNVLRAVTAVVLAGFAGYAGWLAASA